MAVIIPCYSDGEHIEETVASIREDEPVEIVLVDDASPDERTRSVLARFEADGVATVVRHAENRGVGAARNTGVRATSAPYVFTLDSDDVAVPGVLAHLADLLDRNEEAAVAYGDYAEFGEIELVRAVPQWIDPYRLAYTNEYPPTAMFRRGVLEAIGGWEEHRCENAYYEDWHLWLDLAERGERGMHPGPGFVTYRQRVHGPRLLEAAKKNHVSHYRRLRGTHEPLFARIREHRRRSDLSPLRRRLYPLVYGGRPRFRFERKVKDALDRAGVWTMRR